MRESEKSHVMDARDSKKKNGGKSERQRTALWVNHVEARVGEGMKGLPHVMDVGGDDLSLGEFVLRRSLRPRGQRALSFQTRLAPRSPRSQSRTFRLYLLC